MRTLSKIYVFGLVISAFFQTSHAENLSLNKALEMVRLHSRDVAVAQEAVSASERQVDLAKTGYWPKINAQSRAYLWHYENGFEQSTLIDRMDNAHVVDALTYDLIFTYPIVNAGTVDAQKATAVAQRDAAEADVERTVMMTRAQVIDAYFAAVQAEEKSKYYESLVNFVESIVNRIKGGVKVGAFTSNEILSLGVTVGRLKNLQNGAELLLSQSMRNLKQVIGVDEKVPLKLTDGIRVSRHGIPFEQIQNDILANNPGRRAWMKRIDAINETEKREISFEWPKLDLEARYGSNTRYAGVVLTVPIFNGFSYSAKKGVYAQKRAQARIESARFEDGLRVIIENRIDALKKSSKQADQLSDAVRDAQKFWKRANTNFKSVGGDMLLWKAALEDLISVETSMITELASYRSNSEVLKDWASLR